MNHRPFEDWLLEDQSLTSQQQRDLQGHLRSCTSCTAIAESNLALHTTRWVSPAAGFTDRFNLRLAEWHRQQRSRQILGTLVLVFGGLALLYAVAGAAIQHALKSPADWITAGMVYIVYLIGCLQVLNEVGGILFRALPSVVSPAGWFVLSLSGAVVGVAWVLSMRRLARTPQGV